MYPSLLRFLKKQWLEWRTTVFFIVFVLVPVKSSLADWNWVPSGSMNPTIVEGDLVYVNKLAYELRFPLTQKRINRWADPERGDIVVLFSPEDGTRLVKRVIGLPGDEIELYRNQLTINGKSVAYRRAESDTASDLEEPLRRNARFAIEELETRDHAVMSVPQVPARHRNFERLTVPEGQYFLMGDNRDLSHDSRAWGFAERDLIIGEATHVIVSFNMLDHYQPRLRRFFTRLP